ncbi:MAG TPA: hypothetical protein DCY48_04145 [Candidatus Magasanikbacteria bacterium]|nr:MAG: hypothetical protein A3I74_00300 [Candidatus Magasanikbacteria bacterium RIFCSPLOWO2_02_FULL_47_16]OGH80107.1 MAG: hypothetical protein A3C10_02930 [Candidatus Magasanikbacteria bacterium RIFCSPHIGHO2_02_FULL_48_18]OGH83186.1 MAG: hypothetical protein A3G08_02645 [Candidatus Magasanikbacteria bacterium RIFCSPLOWO2_12_FULL_47_9b]HAZ28936.1 hypothetical protein [Candidatus Magasanikbacteria bacterium]
MNFYCDHRLYWRIVKERRRRLRRHMTKAELVLWQEIRKRKLGYRFQRQTSIGFFIVDFYCKWLRLVIEVDGPIHYFQKEYDHAREDWLRRQGYSILRFTNDEVLFDRDRVKEKIREVCRRLDGDLKNSPSCPPPLGGGTV